MFLRRKLTVMATVALLSSSLLAGCTNSGGTKTEGSSNGGELLHLQKYLLIKMQELQWLWL